MITARQSRMAAILLNTDSWIPGAVFSDMLGISLRTLQSEIKSLNTLFKSMRINAVVTSNNRLGYRFEGDRAAVRRRLAKTERQILFSGQGQRDILALLLFEKDYITIGEIANRTFLAKSSVNYNLSEIRRILETKPGISLEVHPRRGLKLTASESVRRLFCVEILEDSMCSFLTCEFLPDAFYDLDEMRSILTDVFAPVDHIMEGAAFEMIARCCVFSAARSIAGFELNEIEPELISSFMRQINDLAEERINYRYTDDELVFLQRYIRRFNVIGITKTDHPDTERRIQAFVSAVNRETGMNLTINDKDLKRFSEQMQRTAYRIQSGMESILERMPEERLNYPIALHFIHTVLNRAAGYTIPDSEADMIIPYVSSLLEELRPKCDVYIVSDLPVSIMYRYRRRLRGYYDYYIRNIFLIPMYLYEQRYRTHDNNAIFLTTDPNLFFNENDMHYFDLTDELTSSEHLGQVFRTHWAHKREEAVRTYKAAFEPFKAEISTNAHDLYAICAEAGYPVNLDNTDILLLGDIGAAVISHGAGQHMHAVLTLKTPLLYKGHSIHTVHYVFCGSEPNHYHFFEYIRLALNNRI